MGVIVIHGAMRTGKTLNADAFARHFGCRRVFGDWPDGAGRSEGPRDGDLVLTTLARDAIVARLGGMDLRVIDINTARAAIGLEAAPPDGFAFEQAARPSRVRGSAAIALPLRACETHIGSVVDADDREVFVVDANGDLPDDVVRLRVAILVNAVNGGDPRGALL